MDNKQTILLVDDQKDFLDVFSAKLREAGFNTIETNSGEEGISKLREIKPNLVLLDLIVILNINMPQMDGVETLSKIKADPGISDTKVVFLTNHGEPVPVKDLELNDKKFAQVVGAIDYLRKSTDLDDLVSEVKRLITKYSA